MTYTRYLIFSSRKKKTHLCVWAVRETEDAKDALRFARRMFSLDRSAFAVRER